MNEKITLEIDADENMALARAILFRIQYLEQQPKSQDETMKRARLPHYAAS